MEFQQMRYVVAVAEERSFTRAAKKCHVVQSALSHQIKALETELGTALFARTSRRVELTAAGEAFLLQARASLEAADRALLAASAADGSIQGTLTVGIIPTVAALNIPEVLGKFTRQHPAVKIKLQVGASDAFVEAISQGAMDIAFLGLPDSLPPAGVDSKILAHEKLVAVVSASHSLANRRRLRLSEIAAEPFVDFPNGSTGRIPSDLAFQAAGLQRTVAFEAMTTDMFLGLVRENLAVALLSPEVIPSSADLRSIPVVAGPTRIEYLAWSSFNPSPAATAFVQMLTSDEAGTQKNSV